MNHLIIMVIVVVAFINFKRWSMKEELRKKIHDLLDKNTTFKIRVNKETSKEVQEMCFEKGVFWNGETRGFIHYLDEPFLCVMPSCWYEKKVLTYFQGEDFITKEDVFLDSLEGGKVSAENKEGNPKYSVAPRETYLDFNYIVEEAIPEELQRENGVRKFAYIIAGFTTEEKAEEYVNFKRMVLNSFFKGVLINHLHSMLCDAEASLTDSQGFKDSESIKFWETQIIARKKFIDFVENLGEEK